MDFPMPAVSADLTAASWLDEHLHRRHGTVGDLVPAGFGTYTRIDHPGLEGGLPRRLLEPLADLVEDHTTTPEGCWMCLWNGYGWLGTGSMPLMRRPRFFDLGSRIAAARARRRWTEERTAALPHGLRDQPLLHLQRLDYHLFHGPVAAVPWFRCGHPLGMWCDGPNLWWPDDHAWIVVSDIDLECTYLAGSADLAAAIAGAGIWNTQLVHPSDPLCGGG